MRRGEKSFIKARKRPEKTSKVICVGFYYYEYYLLIKCLYQIKKG